MRKVNEYRKHMSGVVPEVAIHTWWKRMEQPKKEEGFDDVVKL